MACQVCSSTTWSKFLNKVVWWGSWDISPKGTHAKRWSNGFTGLGMGGKAMHSYIKWSKVPAGSWQWGQEARSLWASDLWLGIPSTIARPAPLVVSNSFLGFMRSVCKKEACNCALIYWENRFLFSRRSFFKNRSKSPLFETKSEIMKLTCHFLTSTLHEVKFRTILILPGPPQLSNPAPWHVLLPSKLN